MTENGNNHFWKKIHQCLFAILVKRMWQKPQIIKLKTFQDTAHRQKMKQVQHTRSISLFQSFLICFMASGYRSNLKLFYFIVLSLKALRKSPCMFSPNTHYTLLHGKLKSVLK